MSSGVITAVLLLAFLGITVWAWSARNRERFRDAAQLPLKDGEPGLSGTAGGSPGPASVPGECCGCGKERCT